MQFLRSMVLAGLLHGALIAQIGSEAAPVEMAVKALFDAIHRGDLDTVRQLFSNNGKFYLPDGAELDPTRPGTARILASRKTCALYVRHVQMITVEVANVVALRRCPEIPPPNASGILNIIMRREPAGWKLMSWREGLLEGVVRPKAETPMPIESEFLTAEERADGWRSLFDGKSFRGWMGPAGEDAPASWRIVDGALATVPRSIGAPSASPTTGIGSSNNVSLRTRQEFTNFDLRFQWMAMDQANSGCLYRLFGLSSGMEYQIADDHGDPGARVDPRQRSGALYGVTPVENSVARPVGEWNDARIQVTRERIEHWLNGVKTAEYSVDVPLPSPILLQYHFTEVRFRNLRIRPLP